MLDVPRGEPRSDRFARKYARDFYRQQIGGAFPPRIDRKAEDAAIGIRGRRHSATVPVRTLEKLSLTRLRE